MLNELKQSMIFLQEGLNEDIHIKKALFVLCKYFKYREYCQNKCRDNLIKWIVKQDQKYYDNYDDLIEYIEDIIIRVYKKNYMFIDKINIPVTLGEMKEIHNLKYRGDKLVAFAMLFFSKLYKKESGEFYISCKKISKAIGLSERQVQKIINKLEYYGVIKIVRRNHVKKIIKVKRGYKVYKSENVYQFLIKEDNQIISHIVDEDDLIKKFWNIYEICISVYEFKSNNYIQKYIQKYI